MQNEPSIDLPHDLAVLSVVASMPQGSVRQLPSTSQPTTIESTSINEDMRSLKWKKKLKCRSMCVSDNAALRYSPYEQTGSENKTLTASVKNCEDATAKQNYAIAAPRSDMPTTVDKCANSPRSIVCADNAVLRDRGRCDTGGTDGDDCLSRKDHAVVSTLALKNADVGGERAEEKRPVDDSAVAEDFRKINTSVAAQATKHETRDDTAGGIDSVESDENDRSGSDSSSSSSSGSSSGSSDEDDDDDIVVGEAEDGVEKKAGDNDNNNHHDDNNCEDDSDNTDDDHGKRHVAETTNREKGGVEEDADAGDNRCGDNRCGDNRGGDNRNSSTVSGVGGVSRADDSSDSNDSSSEIQCEPRTRKTRKRAKNSDRRDARKRKPADKPADRVVDRRASSSAQPTSATPLPVSATSPVSTVSDDVIFACPSIPPSHPPIHRSPSGSTAVSATSSNSPMSPAMDDQQLFPPPSPYSFPRMLQKRNRSGSVVSYSSNVTVASRLDQIRLYSADFLAQVDLIQIDDNLHDRHTKFLNEPHTTSDCRVMRKVLRRDRLRLRQITEYFEKMNWLCFFYCYVETKTAAKLAHCDTDRMHDADLVEKACGNNPSFSMPAFPQEQLQKIDAFRPMVAKQMKAKLPLTGRPKLDTWITNSINDVRRSLDDGSPRCTLRTHELSIYRNMDMPTSIFPTRCILTRTKQFIRSFIYQILHCVLDAEDGESLNCDRYKQPKHKKSRTWKIQYEKFRYTLDYLKILDYKIQLYIDHCELLMKKTDKRLHGKNSFRLIDLLPKSYWSLASDSNNRYVFKAINKPTHISSTATIAATSATDSTAASNSLKRNSSDPARRYVPVKKFKITNGARTNNDTFAVQSPASPPTKPFEADVANAVGNSSQRVNQHSNRPTNQHGPATSPSMVEIAESGGLLADNAIVTKPTQSNTPNTTFASDAATASTAPASSAATASLDHMSVTADVFAEPAAPAIDSSRKIMQAELTELLRKARETNTSTLPIVSTTTAKSVSRAAVLNASAEELSRQIYSLRYLLEDRPLSPNKCSKHCVRAEQQRANDEYTRLERLALRDFFLRDLSETCKREFLATVSDSRLLYSSLEKLYFQCKIY